MKEKFMKTNLRTVLGIFFVVISVWISSMNSMAGNIHLEMMSDEAHKYEVLPGTEGWNDMTPKERLNSCRVSQSEVSNMTTRALVETVLNYPYLANIYAYNSLEEGIERVSNHFPGIYELLQRDDASNELQNYVDSNAELMEGGSVDIKVYLAQDLMEVKENTSSYSAMPLEINRVFLSTPKGNLVLAYKDLTWSDHDRASLARAEALRNHYLEIYPSAQEVQNTINPAYNCHSYAWHSTSTSNNYWIDDPTKYTTDGSYTATFATVGNKVTYTDLGTGTYIHSGILRTKSGSTETVISKWGYNAVFIHEVFDCPYNTDLYSSVSVMYWTRS